MYKIYITDMRSGNAVTFKYKSRRSALNRFIGRCKELGYHYTEVKSLNIVVAGGVDHEYRLELVEII